MVPSLTNGIKTLGLNCLSWAFYHVTVDQNVCNAITSPDHSTFFDVLDVLAQKYYDISKIKISGTSPRPKPIDWQRDNLQDWKTILMNASKQENSKDASKWVFAYYLVRSLLYSSVVCSPSEALCI